jgi:hypothetical protein
MTTATDEQLFEAVKSLRISLLGYDEDSANSPQTLASKIQDDHPLWSALQVSEEAVRDIVQRIKDSDIPAYVPPEGLFSLDTLLQMPPLQTLKQVLSDDLLGMHHAQGGLGRYVYFV